MSPYLKTFLDMVMIPLYHSKNKRGLKSREIKQYSDNNWKNISLSTVNGYLNELRKYNYIYSEESNEKNLKIYYLNEKPEVTIKDEDPMDLLEKLNIPIENDDLFSSYNYPNKSEMDFLVDYNDKFLFSRKGRLKINGKKVDTPVFWLGHVLGGVPCPWKEFEVETLIVNACDILQKKKANHEICCKGIHNYLDFKNLILMDSGGFLFQKKELIDVDPLEIINLYENCKPDLGVILDHPLNPKASKSGNLKRWNSTLKNTEIMFENQGKVELMPVVHGYTFEDLKNACDDLKNLIDNPKAVGLGSLVPLLFRNGSSKHFKDGLKFVVDAVQLVREEFPDSFLHVFGVGSTKTMHLMYALGADSIDSIGWRLKAAYGTIQLPGVGDRHVKSRNNGRPSLNEKEKLLLANCECPVCYNKNLDERLDTLDGFFQSRAMHNAWLFKKEQELFHEKLLADQTLQFLDKRLSKGIFSKAFNHLIEKQNNSSLKNWY